MTVTRQIEFSIKELKMISQALEVRGDGLKDEEKAMEYYILADQIRSIRKELENAERSSL